MSLRSWRLKRKPRPTASESSSADNAIAASVERLTAETERAWEDFISESLRETKKKKKVKKIDVKDMDGLNETINVNTPEGEAAMANILEELKTKLAELETHFGEVKQAVEAAAQAPNVYQAVVDAVVAALEAQGYTVTPPAETPAEPETPATDAEVTETAEAAA